MTRRSFLKGSILAVVASNALVTSSAEQIKQFEAASSYEPHATTGQVVLIDDYKPRSNVGDRYFRIHRSDVRKVFGWRWSRRLKGVRRVMSGAGEPFPKRVMTKLSRVAA